MPETDARKDYQGRTENDGKHAENPAVLSRSRRQPKISACEFFGLRTLRFCQTDWKNPSKPEDDEEKRQRYCQTERRINSIQREADCNYHQFTDYNDQNIDYHDPHWLNSVVRAWKKLL